MYIIHVCIHVYICIYAYTYVYIYIWHFSCNSLKKLLKQPKTLTCYICCLVILKP